MNREADTTRRSIAPFLGKTDQAAQEMIGWERGTIFPQIRPSASWQVLPREALMERQVAFVY